MPVSGKYSIGIFGFAPNEAAMLEVFFNSGKAEGFELVSANKADALLVSVSRSGDKGTLDDRLQQHGSRPYIAVVDSDSAGTEGGVGAVLLVRPLTMASLQRALAELKRKLEQGKTAPDVKASDTRSRLEQGDQRAAVYAEWQARKQRSSQALDDWKKSNSLRQGEALRSSFSLERSELNRLILDAQRQIGQQPRETGGAAPEVASNKPESLLSDELQAPKVSAEMIQQCCGNLPDVDLDSPTERRRVYFSLDGLLLPWVKRAIDSGRASGKPQQVVGVPGALFYLPQDDSFLVGIDTDLLLQLTRTRFGFDEISLLERENDTELPHGRRISADELLWQLSLFTARGRLPETLSADEPRLLNAMPDFERLLETPHARSIAELWQSQRLSAQNIASMLGVPQRFVFSFLVAADAIGLYCP